MAQQLDTSKFYLVGNNLSIDFVNTRIRENGAPKELLESFEDLIAWAVRTELLDLSQAKELLLEWSDRPKAAQVFKRALKFREVLREVIIDTAQGATIKPAALETVNLILKEENGYVEVVRTENGFEKHFHAGFSEPGRLLAPIAEAAADLLCYGNPAYLRKCETPECLIYFYDVTKNHCRRWCSMAICGNRAKAAAFYQRRSMKPHQ
ncbi:MAG: ABATE domain-containing protein [Acidobacteria bacterium]|nr:ABATE domain-containing protein [Acidobacteriota bacterium]MBI3421757.1 ABATE domain-containing protein [Acidobacteriota bacterium]